MHDVTHGQFNNFAADGPGYVADLDDPRGDVSRGGVFTYDLADHGLQFIVQQHAIAQTHDFLAAEGIRDRVVLIASGGIRSAEDVLKAVALGADGVVIGTAELVSIDCVRCQNCERERGCPIGIATTDPRLALQLESEWVRDRIVNLYWSWSAYLTARLRALGLTSIRALRGRRDLLTLEAGT